MKLSTNFTFLLIVLLNVVLKIIFLGNNPYSFDEIVSVKDTLLEFGHVKHEAEWDNNPPFYYYCLWVWHAILPISEFNSRLLSVLFVSLAIGLIYIFSKRHFDLVTAISVTVFLSFSNFLHYYSHESRAYSLVVLLAISSTILYFKYTEQSKVSILLWLSLINFLLIYTHYISALLVVLQYALFPFISKQNKRNYFVVQSVIILSLVAWRFTKKQYLNIIGFNKKGDFWLQKANFSDLIEGLKLLWGGELLFLICLTLVVIIIFKNKGFRNLNWFAKYCFVVGIVPILILYIIGIFKPVFLARYLIFTIPFFVIFIFSGVNQLRKFRYVAISVLLLVTLFKYEPRIEIGTDYRLVAKVLERVPREESSIIINRSDNVLAFTYYYDRATFMQGKDAFSILKTKKIIGSNSSQDALLSVEPESIVYLVQSYNTLFDPTNEFRKQLLTKGKLLFETRSIKGIEFSVIKILK